jgi:hypothetical protein
MSDERVPLLAAQRGVIGGGAYTDDSLPLGDGADVVMVQTSMWGLRLRLCPSAGGTQGAGAGCGCGVRVPGLGWCKLR